MINSRKESEMEKVEILLEKREHNLLMRLAQSKSLELHEQVIRLLSKNQPAEKRMESVSGFHPTTPKPLKFKNQPPERRGLVRAFRVVITETENLSK